MPHLRVQDTIIKDISLDASDDKIIGVINKLLSKNYFDDTGLIYGIGHAIYTLSDPRCELLKAKGEELAKANPDNYKKFTFYKRFEELALKVMEEKKGTKMCANVDFYSGLVYEMLGIPHDLFIPIFAAARLVGWISHDLESLLYNKKIVRPATKYVGKKEE